MIYNNNNVPMVFTANSGAACSVVDQASYNKKLKGHVIWYRPMTRLTHMLAKA